jgi:hypothetical protein
MLISERQSHRQGSIEHAIISFLPFPPSLPPSLPTWSKYTLSQCAWHTRSVNKGCHRVEVNVAVTPESMSRKSNIRTSISSGMAEA